MTEKSSAVTLSDVGVPPAYVLTPPEVTPQKSSCKSKAMVGYSTGVTVALIVVVIMGGIYYYKSMDVLHSTIQKFHTVYKNEKNEQVAQDTEVDKDSNVVVFRLKGKGIADGTLAVFDYTKSISGMYDPEAKECFVMGGIQKQMADVDAIAQGFNTTEETDLEEALNFQKADDYPISDKSILPKPLQAACKYLPTYWMEPATEEEASSPIDDTDVAEKESDMERERSKRATCIVRVKCINRRRCIYIRVRKNGRLYKVRYCYYYKYCYFVKC